MPAIVILFFVVRDIFLNDWLKLSYFLFTQTLAGTFRNYLSQTSFLLPNNRRRLLSTVTSSDVRGSSFIREYRVATSFFSPSHNFDSSDSGVGPRSAEIPQLRVFIFLFLYGVSEPWRPSFRGCSFFLFVLYVGFLSDLTLSISTKPAV